MVAVVGPGLMVSEVANANDRAALRHVQPAPAVVGGSCSRF